MTGYTVSGRGFTSPTLQLKHDGYYATVVGCEAVRCILWAPVSSEGLECPCVPMMRHTGCGTGAGAGAGPAEVCQLESITIKSQKEGFFGFTLREISAYD